MNGRDEPFCCLFFAEKLKKFPVIRVDWFDRDCLHRQECRLPRDMGQMLLRALLIAVAIGVGASATAARAASPCPDPGAPCSIQCYDTYCSVWRACWVTETGLGVCSAPRYGRAPRVRR
jgi:hypothetical protein